MPGFVVRPHVEHERFLCRDSCVNAARRFAMPCILVWFVHVLPRLDHPGTGSGSGSTGSGTGAARETKGIAGSIVHVAPGGRGRFHADTRTHLALARHEPMGHGGEVSAEVTEVFFEAALPIDPLTVRVQTVGVLKT